MQFFDGLDLRILRETLRGEFPAVADLPWELNTQGWDNTVIIAGGQWVLRLPKRTDYPFEKEIEILRRLEGKVSVQVPKIEWLGQKYQGMAYRLIAGEHARYNDLKAMPPETLLALGRDLGQFVRKLRQALPLSEAKTKGWKKHSTEMSPAELELALSRLPVDLKAFGEKIAAWPEPKSEEAFLFGDLHGGNMLLDKQSRLAGVIDFADCGWGDSAYEFHPFLRTHSLVLQGSLEASGCNHSLRDIQILAARYALKLLAWVPQDEQLKLTMEKVALSDLRRYQEGL